MNSEAAVDLKGVRPAGKLDYSANNTAHYHMVLLKEVLVIEDENLIASIVLLRSPLNNEIQYSKPFPSF